MNTRKIEQTLQENEYWFPYHYVPQYEFGKFRHYFLDTWAINYVSTIEFLIAQLENYLKDSQNRDISIVDIGCGDGRFSRELSIALPHSNVVGVDYSKRAVFLANAMNQDRENLDFFDVDITSSHNLGEFDVAFLMEVFEHIPLSEAKQFMHGVRKLIREQGILFLTVPHSNKELEYKHFQHFSVATLTSYLKCDFDIVEIIPFEKKSLSRRIIYDILSNRFFVLNNSRMLSLIYSFYKRNLFFCNSEAECQRIFVKAVAK